MYAIAKIIFEMNENETIWHWSIVLKDISLF